MTTLKKNLRICKAGHSYYKSSDCPTCPVCEQERRPAAGLLAIVSAPARRALEHAGIKTLDQLSQWSESELLKLHGIGPSSIPKLRKALQTEKLSFRKENLS